MYVIVSMSFQDREKEKKDFITVSLRLFLCPRVSYLLPAVRLGLWSSAGLLATVVICFVDFKAIGFFDASHI